MATHEHRILPCGDLAEQRQLVSRSMWKHLLQIRHGFVALVWGCTFTQQAPTVQPHATERQNATVCNEPIQKARSTVRKSPMYTSEAERKRVSGKSRVILSVSASGDVTAVRFESLLGYGLDESILVAVRGMKFAPATRCRQPVPSEFKMSFVFSY